MELANSEAAAYIPGLMLQFASEGHDLDDLNHDAMQAFMEAFQRRLSELFIGLPKGRLLNH